MEINGFEIEKFNIYDIKPGAKTSTCPKCSSTRKKKTEKCMSVFWDTGIGNCNHCGERIQLHTYKKQNATKNYAKPVQKETYTEISDKAKRWFKEVRGISEETLKDLKVTSTTCWMPKAKREVPAIEFNYFLHDELINTKFRAKDKDFRFVKDAEILLYNINALLGSKTCVLVEGEVDVLSYHESGLKCTASVPNGFTLPREDGTSTISTTYLDDYYHIFDDKEKIYLAFDNDIAGKEGVKEFVRRLGAERCYIVDFGDCKDANEYLLKHGKEALANTIATAKIMPIEEIKTIDDVWSNLEDFWINGATKGATIDLPSLDEIFSIEMKQYTLLLSAPGSGKSDLVDHITAKLAIKYGYKTGVCSTENKPLHFHYDKIFRKIMGHRPMPDFINSNRVLDVKNFIREHYIHHETERRYFLEDVLAKFAELVKRKGCRIFVLDPFNKIKLKSIPRSNVNEYTEEYHLLIDEFCTKHDCHVFLVLHPNKLSYKMLGKNLSSDKTYVMPSAYDAKGGGEHFDMSYNVLGMVRDYEREVVQVRTLKVKFQHLGTAGKDAFFKWNLNNGRYTEIDGHFDATSDYIPSCVWDNRSWLHDMHKQIEPTETKEVFKTFTPQDAFDLSNDDDIPF